jgi:hypothetical protein
MRAGKIYVKDLEELDLLDKVRTVKITLYGSLAATGKGHHTPQAILLGLEGSDPETIDTGTIPSRYAAIQEKVIIPPKLFSSGANTASTMIWTVT